MIPQQVATSPSLSQLHAQTGWVHEASNHQPSLEEAIANNPAEFHKGENTLDRQVYGLPPPVTSDKGEYNEPVKDAYLGELLGANYSASVVHQSQIPSYNPAQKKLPGNTGLSQEKLKDLLQNAKADGEVESLYKKDVQESQIGKALKQVKKWKGYDSERMPDFYTKLDLPDRVMAATIKTYDPSTGQNKVIMAYNTKYMDKLRSNSLQRLYVNLHEHGHVGGEHDESRTEGLVRDASTLAKSWLTTAKNLPQKMYSGLQGTYNKIGEIARQREIAQAPMSPALGYMQ